MTTQAKHLKARNYLKEVIANDEYYNNIDAIKQTVLICGNSENFLRGLGLNVYYWNSDCVNFLLDCGYKNASPDMYWQVLARELDNIIAGK